MRNRVLGMVMVMLAFATMCYADGLVGQTVYSLEIKNVSGERLTYVIPTTTIRPGIDKLYGYRIMPAGVSPILHGNSTESYVGIFDGTTVELNGECFDENEANDTGACGEVWPRGKKIVYGVVTNQGTNTILQVYWIRK